MEWDVLLSGISIKAFVNSFTVEYGMDAFCGQLTMDMAALTPFSARQWHIIPAEPDCQVLVKPASTWIDMGTFFVEKPVFQTKPDSSIMQGVWGRSRQAKASAPFASKLNLSWSSDTMMNTIIEDILNECGLTWDAAYNLVGDYLIYAGTFVVNDEYPIDALSNLAALCGGAFVGDRDGILRLKKINFAPVSGDSVLTLTDVYIETTNQTVDFPDFANRVKVYSSGSASGYNVSFMDDKVCLPADETYMKQVGVRVTDSDGEAVNNVQVDFSVDDTGVAMVEQSSVLTGTLYNYSEVLRASSFTEINLSYPPSAITAIYALYAPTVNLISQVVDITDERVTLGTALNYCDAMLRVVYNIDGVARVNIYGRESISGDSILAASVQGETDSVDVFTNNGCSCPVSLMIEATPTSLEAGENSAILAVAETDGINLSGVTATFQIIEGAIFGTISYSSLLLGPVSLSDEIQTVYEEVRGEKRVKTKYKIDTDYDIEIYTFDRDEDNAITPTGVNLFDSVYNENEIILNDSDLENGTELVLYYYCQSGAVTIFTASTSLGASSAQSKVKVTVPGQTEEPLEAMTTIAISDDSYDDTTSEDSEYSLDTGPDSGVYQEFTGRWCGHELSKYFGKYVQWDDLWGVLETFCGVMFDGYNPKAYIRHDALMANFGNNRCSYSVDRWPIYFRKWEGPVGNKYIPASIFLFDPEADEE